MNINEFINEEQDLVVNDATAYAMWFNPQKGFTGLALTEEQADVANFKPDDTWVKKTVKVGRQKEELKLWVCETPRMVVLNAVDKISKSVKGKARPYFSYSYEKNGIEVQSKYCPIIFLLVGKDNQIISSPIVLRPKKACTIRFGIYINQFWTSQILGFYQEQFNHSFGSEKPASIFFARHIFEPTFEIDELENSSGASSQAWVCNGSHPINIHNIYKVGSDEAKLIESYVNNIPALLEKIRGEDKPQEESTELNVDSYTDPETGEVKLPEELMPF